MKKLFVTMEHRPIFLWLAALIVSSLFLLFASVYTTPLNDYYGYDSAYYLLIGKGICQGKIPYLDLYDQKGPLVFYLNALGYWITGSRGGVWMLQVLFMTFTVMFLYRTFRLFVGFGRAWLLIVLFFFLYCGTAREGDLVEEWSLVFSALPMYLSLRFLTTGHPLRKHPLKYSFAYGICLGAHLMNRATNAALVCGLILSFTFLMLREKEYTALMKNALSVLMGTGLFLLPWILYLRSVGALGEFFYAAYIHNYHYAANGTAAKNLSDWAEIFLKNLMVPVSAWIVVKLVPGEKISLRVAAPAVCMGVIGMWTMTMGFGLKNYFMNIIPVLLLDVCLGMLLIPENGSHSRRKSILATAALCLVCVLPYTPEAVRHAGRILYYDVTGYSRWEKLKMDGSYISSLIGEDRESVWGFDIFPREYLYADVLPCFRHFATQSWMAEAEPQISDEIREMLRSSPPKWVMLAVESRELLDTDLQEIYGYEYLGESPSGAKLLYRHSG